MENKDYFKKVGEFFGYPECCIEEFVERVSIVPLPALYKEQQKVCDNGGFLPCKKCSEKLLKNNKRVDSLILPNREAPKDYLDAKINSEADKENYEALLEYLKI